MEWKYTVNPYSKEPVMLVNKHIGFDEEEGPGIDGAAFQSELLALDMLKPTKIDVWINSQGGIVLDGMNMYSATLLSATPVDTTCVGTAASIAGVLFQAGRKRKMMDYAFLMYHSVSGSEDKKLMNVMNDSINKMTARSGKSAEEISYMMKKTTYINANDALEYGMCDEVVSSSDHNKKRMSHFTAATNSYWKEANSVVNSILNLEDKNNMKNVANKLGLNSETSEAGILEALTKLQNEAGKVINLNSELVLARNRSTELEGKLAALQIEKDALEGKAAEEAEAALDEKCLTMVTNFAKAGRIKNEEGVIAFWTGLAKVNFDMIKNQIEALPVNASAPKIEVVNNATKGVYTFAAQMGLIANKQKEQAK